METESLWLAHHSKILRYIQRRIDDPQLAEDLAAETFTRAIDAQRRGKGATRHTTGWLYRIAHNLVIDHYRARDRRPDRIGIDLVAHRVLTNDEPVNVAITIERHARLYFAIGYLTPEQQSVIIRRLQGYPFHEIAAELDTTEGAVKALLHRGKATLHDVLKGWTE